MKIGLIDNEYCTRENHSFPNLALMKLSSYHKRQGDDVKLISFDTINPNLLFTEKFDKIFVSKVFSDTYTPEFMYHIPNLEYSGSGFFYDMAPRLPKEIEHIKPDYDLYKNDGEYYKNFSIGFITRGCIRKCIFCINRNYSKVEFNTYPNEFIDYKIPYLMLLDDNITAYKHFEEVFKMLNDTGKPFVFKQGMDFRLLTEKKMKIIWESNYYCPPGSLRTFHFAFDNIDDSEIIERKLKIYYENTPYKHNIWFYVLVGFDRNNKYDISFYMKDLEDMLKRIEILFRYTAYPYIMLHENYKRSPFKETIRQVCRICNFPALLGTKSIAESLKKGNKNEGYETILKYFPKYLDLKINTYMFKNLNKINNTIV